MALGLQNEKAGRVSMVNYLQVALMYISDITLFGKNLELLDLIGTIVIFGFNFINGLMKTIERLVELRKFKANLSKK
jgi:drug/metabolite transporter (DMT)-like permease